MKRFDSRDQRRHTPKVQTQGLYQRAFKEAFRKLDPRSTIRNPVMFVVWIGTVVTLVLTLVPDLFGQGSSATLNALITVILAFTVLFANFAEAVAEGRGKAQADSLRTIQTETTATKLLPDGSTTAIPSSQLHKGDVVRVVAGEVIPADGEVTSGIGSVDESAITGGVCPCT